ncbi:MAG: hypothetical protein WBC61_00545 [Dehalococcoidia bacterium]
MSKKQMNIPINAMVFNAGRDTVVKAANDTLSMTAYSGGVIENHFYWGSLIIDLSGMVFPKESYPILEEHQKDKKLGFATRDQIGINGGLRIEGAKLLDTDAAREFRKLSKESFPYQASIYCQPTDIERLDESAKAVEVNSTKVKGPATIWRQSIFKEASVVVFGYCQDTESRVTGFSEDSHLTLSLNVEGDLRAFEDERLANEIFAASGGKDSGQADDNELEEARELLSTGECSNLEEAYVRLKEDSALASQIFSGKPSPEFYEAAGQDEKLAERYEGRVQKLMAENNLTATEARELLDEQIAGELFQAGTVPVEHRA